MKVNFYIRYHDFLSQNLDLLNGVRKGSSINYVVGGGGTPRSRLRYGYGNGGEGVPPQTQQ